MILSKSIFLGLLILSTSKCFSQSTVLNFRYYNTSHGLGSNNVRKTIQDSKGYIWCATQDGLYKFDGRDFTSYNKSLSKNHSLSGSDIRDLLIQNDTLWCISSYGGIDAIDIITGNIVYSYNQQSDPEFKSVLFLSIALKNNVLFIGSDKGLYIFDTQKKSLFFLEITIPITFDGTLNINKIILAPPDKLWLFCSKGKICILNTLSFKIVGIYESNIARFYDCELINYVVITATSDGIKQYSFQNEQIKPVSFPFESKYSQHSPVFAIKKDIKGNVWFSDKNNLFKIDLSLANVQHIYPGRLVNGKDLTSSVYGIFFDDKNNLWLSSQEGLLFSTSKPTAFLAYTKSRNSEIAISHSYYIFPYNDTTIFVCAEDGLYQVNPLSFSIASIDLKKTYFFAFIDLNNNLIVSNDEGTFILRSKRLIPFANIYPEFRSSGMLMLNSYLKMNDSVFVLGTQNKKGIYLWDPRKKSIKNIHTGSDDSRLADDNVNTLFKATNDSFWVLCDNSISVYNIRTDSISELNIENPETKTKYTIFFDACKIKSSYYLASYSNGIIELDNNYRYKKSISTREGLANNGIYKILPYKDSLIVVSTNNGISAIDLDNGHIKNYYENDGLQSNVFEELSGNTKNDLIYAGGKDGFTLINPRFFNKNLTPPVVLIRQIEIETPTKKIDSTNLETHSFSVPRNAIQTRITFSALNYSNPDKTSFYYKINQLHDSWIHLGPQNFISLIGLSPGTYHLQVQAFNEDGVPSEIKELTLVFLPKWYQTWLFRIIVLVAIVSIFYGLYRFRINHLKKEEKIRNQVAGDLHDELGSTLNSVKIFTSLALMEKDNTSHLEKIKEATQMAIAGVKDIIWVLDDKRDTLDHLLSRINQFARPLCEAAGISYKQQSDGDPENYKLGKEEKRNLYMIIKESINNSIKYSDCTLLEILIKNNGGKLNISISDNGKGFDKDKIASGYGLRNIMHRSKEIGYHAEINSLPGNGTLIYLEKK